MVSMKCSRKSNVGVARGYAVTLAKGTWDSQYAMYGGDFLSKNGIAVYHQIANNGLGIAIGSRACMYINKDNFYSVWDGVESNDNFSTSIADGVQYTKIIYTTTISYLGNTTEAFGLCTFLKSLGTALYPRYFNLVTNVVNGQPYINIQKYIFDTSITLTDDANNKMYRPIYQSGYIYVNMQFKDSAGGGTIRYFLTKADFDTSSTAGDTYTEKASGTVGDMWRVNDNYWVMNNGGTIKRSTDQGANWAEINGGDGSATKSVVATDGTYIYAIDSDDANTIIYKGTLDGVSVTWSAIFDCGSTYTFNGMDADADGHYVIGLVETTVETTNSYMITLENSIDVYFMNAIIKNGINAFPSSAELMVSDVTPIKEAFGTIFLYDDAGTERFRGYALPTASKNEIVLESVNRELVLRSANSEFTENTIKEMVDSLLGDCSLIDVGTNNLENVTDYAQKWGSAISSFHALHTLAMMSAGFLRPKVAAIDAYLISTPNSSGKTITFGSTTAQLLGERVALNRPCNKLVVFGGFASDGVVMQKTLQDANDQLLNGILTLYIRRCDITEGAALVLFANEVWERRKATNSIAYIYTIQIMASTWFDAGDTVTIANASYASDTMQDGDYFILSAIHDLVRDTIILEVSTSIVSTQNPLNDILPLESQSPIESTDSVTGTIVEKVTLADLLAGHLPVAYNDLIIPIAGGKLPASNYPDWASFTTNTNAYKFAVDEYIDLPPVELDHGWVEGSTLKPHVHIVLSAATGSEQKVQFTLYYSWGDVLEVMDAETSVSGEYTVPNGTADKTHLLVTLSDIDGANKRIGSILNCRLKRVAKSAGGNELTAEPFVLSFGIHVEYDTIGSKAVTTK
jgi:hypothetical protein